ncbi:MAG: endonuclease domain-containing protein [Sphingomonas oligoaromativorans]
MTLPEVRLWTILRSRPGGLRFRRQHPIGAYVIDFYCPQARLAIEVDGIAHDMGDAPERDARRDAWLAGQGIATLRISASDVLKETEAVVRLILERCARPLHHPAGGPPPHFHGEDV